jgi:hypothetical protein
MVGTPREYGMIQLNVTVYPEHARIIEKILKREYSKPIAHKSASEVIRRAIEHYADYLGIKLNNDKS